MGLMTQITVLLHIALILDFFFLDCAMTRNIFLYLSYVLPVYPICGYCSILEQTGQSSDHVLTNHHASFRYDARVKA